MSLRPRGGFQIDIPDFGIAERIERSGNELAALPQQFARLYAMSQMNAPNEVAQQVTEEVPQELVDQMSAQDLMAIQMGEQPLEGLGVSFGGDGNITYQKMIPNPHKERAMQMLAVADPQMYMGIRKAQQEETIAAAEMARAERKMAFDEMKARSEIMDKYGKILSRAQSADQANEMHEYLKLNNPDYAWLVNQSAAQGDEFNAHDDLPYLRIMHGQGFADMDFDKIADLYNNASVVKRYEQISPLVSAIQNLMGDGKVNPQSQEAIAKLTYQLIEEGIVRDDDLGRYGNTGLKNAASWANYAESLRDGTLPLSVITSMADTAINIINGYGSEVNELQGRMSEGLNPYTAKEAFSRTGQNIPKFPLFSEVESGSTKTVRRPSGFGGSDRIKHRSGVLLTADQWDVMKKQFGQSALNLSEQEVYDFLNSRRWR